MLLIKRSLRNGSASTPHSLDHRDLDKHLLEIMQRQIADDPRGMDYLEVTLGADGAGIFVRQILNKKLAAEGRSL